MRLINADALKQEIRKGTRYFVRVWDPKGRETWEMEKDLSLKEIDEIIDNAPTIDVETIKHGKWMKIGMIDRTWAVHRCSACGYQTIDNGQYCTECGARMDLDREWMEESNEANL